MKTWKVAISLAVVAALVVPAWTGVWRLSPSEWSPLSAEQRERISGYLQETNYCKAFQPPVSEYSESVCQILLSQLANNGTWKDAQCVTLGYLAKNFFVMAATFVSVFLIAMILPLAGRRYLTWLRK